jgi:hypothetical protein
MMALAEGIEQQQVRLIPEPFMTDARSKRSAGHSYCQRPKDFYLAFCFGVAAVLLHASALVADATQLAQFKTLVSHTVTYLLVLIGLGLLANVFGLGLRTAAGIKLSLGALLLSAVGYVLWYKHSRRMLDLLLSNPFYQSHPEAVPPHPFGLMGATWVNLVVLVMSGVLFVWELKTLRGMRGSVAKID